MFILSEQEIKTNYLMKDAYADLKQGIIHRQQGAIENPLRTVIDVPEYDASVLYMPSIDISEKKSATKVVSIFPQNPAQGKATTQGVLVLTDATNGEHLCLMNASYLTRLRTGALSAIGTNKLARRDAKVLGVIGTGAMAFEQVLGVLEVRSVEEIILFNRTEEKAHHFQKGLRDFGVSMPMKVVTNVDELVKVSDIINCSTRSNEPVFRGELLRPGTHINGVGSYLPEMREVDVTTIQRAAKIVVDDFESAKEEAGEMIHAAEVSDWSFDDIVGELADLAMDDDLVRENNDEITFFKSVGTAYFDLVVGSGAYKKALELGIGQQVTL